MSSSSSPSLSPAIDPNSGYCAATRTFHSLRPELPLPSPELPLSAAAFALSNLPSPLSSSAPPAFLNSSTGASLSYPLLLSRVLSLSSSLRYRYRLSSGHTAFVLSPPSLHLPVLYLSLLHLGVVVCPANPISSPSEISRQLALVSPVSLIFATSSALSKLSFASAPVLLLDSPEFVELCDMTENNTNNTAEVPIPQSSPAAILFSSGTSGRLKAVVLTHRNLIAALAPFSRPSPPTTTLFTVPLFHVYGFFFLFKTVAAGETGVLVTERFEVGRALRAAERFGVTNVIAAPPVVLAMVRFAEAGGRAEVWSLGGVSCGGAPMGVELIRRFRKRFPTVVLSQSYGLTESSSGIFRCVGPEESQRLGAAGRLVPNCEARIVDPVTGIALGPCDRGELWIRGPTIMKGYMGDEEATAACLTAEGWLKTGDHCHIDRDGFLFVVDRLKELIKYKGYQVPPAELEHLLQTHKDVIEAAVIPYPDEEAGEIPMAFVVRQHGSNLSEAEIIAFVANQVAPHKKIRRVSFVQSIPKNAAGKLLRKDLIRIATSKINSNL